MRSINASPGNADWDKSFVQDLGYIKKHLRYPLKWKTIAPVIFWCALFSILTLAGLFFYYLDKGDTWQFLRRKEWMFIYALMFPGLAIRHIQSLKFITVFTDLYIADNSRLIESFLHNQQMLVFRHPDIPEVYQIISRNVSLGKEDREVMVFIADDKRILINSHYTNGGWRLISGERHHRQMAKMLKDYINTLQSADTGLSHTGF